MATRTMGRTGLGGGMAARLASTVAPRPTIQPNMTAASTLSQGVGRARIRNSPADEAAIAAATQQSHSVPPSHAPSSGLRRLSQSIMPSRSSALPGSKVQKLEKIVESVKPSTRPLP